MSQWIRPKDQLPPEKVLVMARNPYVEAISWIDGKDELGKPSWSHDHWEHADGFVSEWRYLTSEECDYLMQTYSGSKMEKYQCYLCNGVELLSPFSESQGSITMVSNLTTNSD